MALRGDRAKQLAEIRSAFGFLGRVAVETGTWMGQTTQALSTLFEVVYTVDLSEECYRRATDKFIDTNVICIRGDSAEVVGRLSGELRESVFWFLDAHFPDAWPEEAKKLIPQTNPMPLHQELYSITSRQYTDLIIVDDVHAFGSNWGNGRWKNTTVESLQACVKPVLSRQFGDCFAMLRTGQGA